MAQFQSETTADLKAIEAKLDDAQRELIRLWREAPAAALRIELGKAEDGDAELLERFPEVRAQVDRLSLARDAAQQAERDRQNSRLIADDESRRRATSQHLSRAVSALDKCSSALDVALRSFDDAKLAFASARASAPADLRAGDGFVLSAFSDYELSKLFIAELARHCEAKDIASPLWRMPYLESFRTSYGAMHSMHEIVAGRIGRIKADLAAGAIRLQQHFTDAAPIPAPAVQEPLVRAAPANSSPQRATA